MRARITIGSILFFFIAFSALCGEWQAGVGRQIITPEQPMRMSGYAGRTRNVDSKLHNLWVKALALQDPAGTRVLILTMDLIGFDKELSDSISKQICEEHKLPREALILSASHTHTGPIVGKNLGAMYDLSENDSAQVERYTGFLRERCVKAATEALAAIEPATISMGIDSATFAINRRDNVEKNVPALILAGQLKGVVDHDVPVLKVMRGEKLAAVLFGYACHCTTLNSLEWSGDFAGFAQIALEREYPGATALYFAGCGADQNPLPRRSVALAEKYGELLANAVKAALSRDLKTITGQIACGRKIVELPFEKLPDQSRIEALKKDKDTNLRRYGTYLEEQLRKRGSFHPTYSYPINVWQFGEDLTFIALGGEVVADYSLLLKKELGVRSAWVAAYCNDVMAYIPSKRVLTEGGYEGRDSMMFYGLPSAWDASIEDILVTGVCRLVQSIRDSSLRKVP